MNHVTDRGRPTSVSVVIPSFNSAQWLPSTLEALTAALSRTSWAAEIIVVNDGSTDDTTDVVNGFALTSPYTVRLLHQANEGRFRARWEGLKAAKSEWLLILDSRIPMHVNSLQYLQASMATPPFADAWNCHIVPDPTSPLVGRFWEVPTYVFWGEYLAKPRPMLITPENFDRVPKGTTCLFVRKALYEAASLASWPEDNAKLASDDTKLLRYIAGKSPIRIDPNFAATYRPRTTLPQFLEHSWNRGTMFVDSYAGTSPSRNAILVALVVIPPLFSALLVVVASMGNWVAAVVLLACGFSAAMIPLFLAAARGCPPRAQLAFLTYIAPFGAVFWAGLARGLVLHRRSFSIKGRLTEGKRVVHHAREAARETRAQ